MNQATIGSISPCFIVRDVPSAISFYAGKLGFEVGFKAPDEDPFFAIVQRDAVMIFIKAVGVDPVPNHTRHHYATWDAYVYVPEPDSLATEFAGRGVTFKEPVQDTDDGLRGFEVADADGYILFFGRPR